MSQELIDMVVDMREEDAVKFAEKLLAEGVAPATVNRVMEVLRAILKRCADDWEWIDRTPKVRMLKEPTRRIRYLFREEAQRLLEKAKARPEKRSRCR